MNTRLVTFNHLSPEANKMKLNLNILHSTFLMHVYPHKNILDIIIWSLKHSKKDERGKEVFILNCVITVECQNPDSDSSRCLKLGQQNPDAKLGPFIYNKAGTDRFQDFCKIWAFTALHCLLLYLD